MVADKKVINQARYAKYAKIRDSLGYSDARVASETGVFQSTLSAWKSGEYTPSFGNVMKIATFLNVSPSEFEVIQEEGE